MAVGLPLRPALGCAYASFLCHTARLQHDHPPEERPTPASGRLDKTTRYYYDGVNQIAEFDP